MRRNTCSTESQLPTKPRGQAITPAQWITVAQAAELCEVDYQEIYNRRLSQLEFRRIGTRLGSSPFGHLIRIELVSLKRSMGQPETPIYALPR